MKIFFNTGKEQRNTEVQYIKPYNGGLFYGTYGDQPALSLSTVFAAVDMISNAVAELPIQVKEYKEDCNDVIVGHRLNKILDNMIMSKFNFMKQLVCDILLYGDAFVYIQRSGDGEILDLIYLPKGVISQINYDKAKRILSYSVSETIKGVPKNIQDKDMLHFFKNSYDGIHGRGILSYANRAIKIGNYTEESAKDFFGSGLGIKGILKFNEMVPNLDKDEIRQSWQQVHGGQEGGSGLAICDWNVDFIPVSLDPAKSQMIESRLFNVTEIARYFGISPVLLQDLSHSSYSTIEAAQLEFLSHTLLPFISLFENEFNRKLSDGTFFIDLDEKYLMTTDKQAEANYIKTLVSCGVICVNEGRKMIGLSPIEGGNKHFIAYTDIDQNTINKPQEEADENEDIDSNLDNEGK